MCIRIPALRSVALAYFGVSYCYTFIITIIAIIFYTYIGIIIIIIVISYKRVIYRRRHNATQRTPPATTCKVGIG